MEKIVSFRVDTRIRIHIDKFCIGLGRTANRMRIHEFIRRFVKQKKKRQTNRTENKLRKVLNQFPLINSKWSDFTILLRSARPCHFADALRTEMALMIKYYYIWHIMKGRVIQGRILKWLSSFRTMLSLPHPAIKLKYVRPVHQGLHAEYCFSADGHAGPAYLFPNQYLVIGFIVDRY